MTFIKYQNSRRGLARAIGGGALAMLIFGACAASRPPEPGSPRPTEPPYPILLSASDDRREKALATWTTLTGATEAGNLPAPELQPVTATLRALPALDAPALLLRLPQVGGATGQEPTDEETRESLRRFIASAAPLLGVDLQFLSLVEVVEENNGTKRARYQQRPFLYPLRGDYGTLNISFTPDGRVLQLSSTAIPDTERLRRALEDVSQAVTADEVAKRLAGSVISYTDASGNVQGYTFTEAANEITLRELVVYPLRRVADQSTIALHLAWEVSVNRGAVAPLLVYVDVVSGEVIAAAPATGRDARAS